MSNSQPLPPAPAPTPAPNQGGFWNDLKNLPGEAVKAVTSLPVVGKAIGTAMSWANKPLQEVQKDYKFIHSLYADHGFGAGLLGTFGVLAGGAIGSILPGEGTVLGAGIGAALTRNILGRVVPTYQNSFDKSNDPNYLVSFGRDIAHGLSNIPGFGTLGNTNTGLGQVVSGIADASFDFEADPLATAGKLNGALKKGNNIAVATEVDPATGLQRTKIDPDTGKPIIRNTLPFASSATGLTNFLSGMSTKIITADQYDQVMANPLRAAQNRAVNDIVSVASNPDASLASKAGYIHTTYGIPNGWSATMSKALANVSNRFEADQIFKQSLYSKELADAGTATSELRLPSRTVGKLLSEKIGPDAIRNSDQATNFNDQVNLLLPRKSAVMEPVLNEDGTPALDANNQPKMQPKTKTVYDAKGNAKQEQIFKINAPALFKPGNGAIMNALAGKVRSFTGKRPLSFDTNQLALSSERFDPADPGAADTALKMAYLSMPNRLAVEHAGNIMLATDDGERLARFRVLQQEVLKNLGIADTQSSQLFSSLKDASEGNGYDHAVYGVNQGQDVGGTEIKPEYGGGTKSVAITQSQRFQGAMIDFKKARQELRAAKAYGALYNPVDDFFTHYTNVIFAPLALLSPAFGLRVSAGEALHQVIRRGLPNYLTNVLASTIGNLDNKYKAWHLDRSAMSFTDTDKDAIDAIAAAEEKEKAVGWNGPRPEKTSKQLIEMTKNMSESDLKDSKIKEQIAWVKKYEKQVGPVPGIITDNEVTKEIHSRSETIRKTFKGLDDSLTSKQAWNNGVNAARAARFKIMPLGYLANQFAKSELLPYFVKDKIRAMDRFQDVYGSRGPTAGVSAAHQASQELAAKEAIDVFAKEKGHGSVPGQELAGLTTEDPHYRMYLAKNRTNAAADLAQRDIARDYLKSLKDPEFKALSPDQQFASLVDAQAARIRNPNMYQAYRSSMDGYTKYVPESFAKTQIDHLQGLVHGANNKIDIDALQKIAKGEGVTEKELKSLPQAALPIKVLGRLHMPTISDSLQRVEQMGYRKFVTPVMDYISRQPLFADFFTRRLLTNQPLIDMGLLSEDEAVRMTAMQATREMIPTIHSPAIRSQWAIMHRNLLPFYFAQEQAMRRTGRLLMTNPQAFRDFQIVQQGLNNPGFVHTDANGQKYIVYPMLGEFGNALSRGLNSLGMTQFSGLPTSITGNTASLLTVLPEIKTPGVSPFVNFAASEISQKFPWTTKAANATTGGYLSNNWIDTFMPSSTMRDLFNAMNMDDRESTVYNSKLSAIAAAYYHGDLPENYTSLPAFQQAQILAKIENNAKSNLLIKGLFAFFLPLSPTVSNDYYTKDMQTLRSEYLNLLNTKDPSTGANYTAAGALNKFLQETGSPSNPNRALAYTVARTQNGSSGAYVPLADSTISWIDGNQKLLNNPAYSSASPYLIPQVADSADALAVENKLLLDHFRSKVTSQQFLTSLYVKQGWQDLASSYAAYQTVLTDARKSNNRQAEYNIGQAWKQITANYGQSNPVWFANYNDPTRPVQSAKVISQFQTMNQKGLLPNTPEGNGIKDLLANYQYYHNGLLANTINGQHLPGYSTLMDVWYTYVDNLAVSNPRLQSVITSVFRRAV